MQNNWAAASLKKTVRFNELENQHSRVASVIHINADIIISLN